MLEVSTKTIHRDLEFMRDSLGFEFAYDGSVFSYVIQDGSCPFCGPPESILAAYVVEQLPEPLLQIKAQSNRGDVLAKLDNVRIANREKLKEARKIQRRRTALAHYYHNKKTGTAIVNPRS